MSAPTFTPTSAWQDVPDGAVCPPGLHYQIDPNTGLKRARLAPNGDPQRSEHPSAPEGIRLTRMKKAGLALLSKRITLGEDGRPVSDGSPCAMSHGTATRVALDWWTPATDLAALILDLGSHEALVLGDHVAGRDRSRSPRRRPTRRAAATAARSTPSSSRTANRRSPCSTSIRKAISDATRARLDEHRRVRRRARDPDPRLSAPGPGDQGSTSAGLRNEETGETFAGSGGQHVYLFVRDGADIPRFLRDLQKRAWLAGLGWIMVSARGSLLIRSIVDVTVGQPRAVGLRRQAEGRGAAWRRTKRRGGPSPTRAICSTPATACPPLTAEEERRYSELVDAAKREKQPEVEAAKEQAAETIARLRGIAIEKARAVVEASTQGRVVVVGRAALRRRDDR